MQTICSFLESLAFNRDRIAKADGGVLVCAGAPDLAVWNQSTPNLAVIHQRPMVGNRDVGDADALGNLGALTGKRQIENERLGEARAGKAQRIMQNTSASGVCGVMPSSVKRSRVPSGVLRPASNRSRAGAAGFGSTLAATRPPLAGSRDQV